MLSKMEPQSSTTINLTMEMVTAMLTVRLTALRSDSQITAFSQPLLKGEKFRIIFYFV